MHNVRRKCLKIFRGEYQKMLEAPSPEEPPQLLAFDEGRTIDGPLLFDLDIRVCTAWLHHELEHSLSQVKRFRIPWTKECWKI